MTTFYCPAPITPLQGSRRERDRLPGAALRSAPGYSISPFQGGDETTTSICPIDFTNKADVVLHDKMVALVEQMLALHKSVASAKTPHDKDSLQRQIDATDQQIDPLVYELYGLTDDEIKIVEEGRR